MNRFTLKATRASPHSTLHSPQPKEGIASSAPLTAVLFYFLSVIFLIIHPEPRTELKRSFPLLTFPFISYSIISLFLTFSGAVRRGVKWRLFYMYMKCGDVRTLTYLSLLCSYTLQYIQCISGLFVSSTRA